MSQNNTEDPRRVFIGNISPRVTEYDLLQVMKGYPITSLDYCWHTSGPLKGQPKGFAFVSFDSEETAQKVMNRLNGHVLAGRPIVVAPSQQKADKDRSADQNYSKLVAVKKLASSKTMPGNKAPSNDAMGGINPRLQAMPAKHVPTERKIRALERTLNRICQSKNEESDRGTTSRSLSRQTTNSSEPRFHARQRSKPY